MLQKVILLLAILTGNKGHVQKSLHIQTYLRRIFGILGFNLDLDLIVSKEPKISPPKPNTRQNYNIINISKYRQFSSQTNSF